MLIIWTLLAPNGCVNVMTGAVHLDKILASVSDALFISVISSDFMSSDLISSEMSALRLLAATVNSVTSQRSTQFAVAATNRSALKCDQMR